MAWRSRLLSGGSQKDFSKLVSDLRPGPAAAELSRKSPGGSGRLRLGGSSSKDTAAHLYSDEEEEDEYASEDEEEL